VGYSHLPEITCQQSSGGTSVPFPQLPCPKLEIFGEATRCHSSWYLPVS